MECVLLSLECEVSISFFHREISLEEHVLLLLILACFLRVKTKVTLCTTAHGSGLTRTKDSKSQCLSVCSVVCVWSSENGNHNIGRSRRRDTHFNSVSAQALLSYLASILPLYGLQWKLYRSFFKKSAQSVCTRAARFLGGFTSHHFLGSLGYVWVTLRRIWPRVVVFRIGESVL